MEPSPIPLSQALDALARLTPTDPRLMVLTREANLYTTVLREQGQRVSFSPNDLKQLFTRMLDLMLIEPILEVKPTPTDPPIDLDQLEKSIARIPGKPSPALKLSTALKAQP